MLETFMKAGISLTTEQADKLNRLTELMLAYNEKVNLTRITERSEIIEKHYIDSILPFTMFDVPRGTSVADIGTGAGFPSLPLMIWRNDLRITMVESLQKRVDYLNFVMGELGLSGSAIHARGEELSLNADYREKFDIATARAVAALPTLCEYCIPFVKLGGRFIALKGVEDEANIAANAIKVLGGKLLTNNEYSLPNGDRRRLIVIEKVKMTPARYPRHGGQIKKSTL